MSSEVIKDLVGVSYDIYELLLLDSKINGPISLLCCRKSAYFALAIVHLPCYDKERVSVEMLSDDLSMLKPRPMVYILDTVITGKNISSISSELCRRYPRSSFRFASVNHPTFMPRIPIYMQFISSCVYSVESLPNIDSEYNDYREPIISFAKTYTRKALKSMPDSPCLKY